MTPRAGFTIDLHRCIGCGACVVACRLENQARSAAPWRRVVPLNDARYPGGPTYFLSVACHHCERPACARACPSAADEQRADGIVVHHDERCLGCRYCEMACPFGAPRWDDARRIVTKCDFCRARTEAGDPPACVAACPTGALEVLGAADGIPNKVSGSGTGDRADGGPCPKAGPSAEAGFAQPVSSVPGFNDPAGCRPSIRFKLPRGIRGRRLQTFLKSSE